MIATMATLEAFQRLGLALAIGILVGVERGWRERGAQAGKRTAGIRTYGLAGFLGGFCGFLYPVIGPALPIAIFSFFSVAMIVFSRMQADEEDDYSVTGVVAAITVFALGLGAVVADTTATAAAAVVITGLLAAREPLHGFLRHLTWLELRAALILLAMTVVVLPLLPNEPIDPWGAINPFELWLMTVLVALMSSAGYVLIKFVGPRAGTLLTGIAGGIVSSTAVTLSFARRSREAPHLSSLLSAGAMASGAMSLTRALVICCVIAPGVAAILSLSFGPAAAVLAAGSLAGVRGGPTKGSDFAPRNPLEVLVVLRFAAILAVVGITTHLALTLLGAQSLPIISFVSGIGDLDAITLTIAGLSSAQLTPQAAAQGIAIAAFANLLAKIVLAASAGTTAYWLRLAIATAVAIAAGIALHLSLAGATT